MKRFLSLAIPAAFLVSPLAAQTGGEAPEIRLSESPGENGGVFRCNPGPWGDLEYYHTYLEAPDRIMELVNTPSENTTWFLAGMTFEELRDLFSKCGMAEETQASIFEQSALPGRGPPFLLFPTPEDVDALSPICRTRLYAVLRRFPENRFHRSPAIIESGDLREWFAESDLAEETIAHMEALSYRIGKSLAFSDVPAVLSRIGSDREERALLRAMTRTRSLILRLRISEESDHGALKAYWTAGMRRKDVLPLFESIAHVEGVEFFDVAHLLPPTPRKYLYTFPSASLGVEGAYPDSFWTSLNFFSYLPNQEFMDNRLAQAFIAANYEEVRGEYRFGDLLIFRDSVTGRALHSCIFVADDIVYTKNGRSMMRPFLLMKVGDLAARYSLENSMNIEVWRGL